MEKKEILPNLGKDVQNQQKIDFRVNSSQNDYNEDQEKNQIQKEQLNQLRRSMGSLQEEEKEEFKSDNMVFQLVDKKQGNQGNGKQFGKSVNFQRNQEEQENQNQNQNEQFEIEEEDENQNDQKNQSYFKGQNQNYSQYYGQELEEEREEFDYDINEQNRVQINNLMNDDIQLSLVYQENYNKEQFLNNQGERQNKSGSPYQIDYQNSNLRFGEASSNNLNNYNKKLGLSGMNKKTTDVNSIYNYSTASNFYRVGSRVGTTQQGSRKNRTLVKGQWSSNKIDNNFLEQSAIQFDQNSNLNFNNSNLNGNGRYRRAISQSNQKRILNNRVGNSSQMNLDNSFYVQDNFVNNKSFQQKSLNQQSQIKNPYYQAKNVKSSVVTPTQQKKGQSFSSIKALSKFQKNINSGMMEKWINDTIMESELYVPDKKEKFEAPLKNYKLDLISLSGKDVNKESIQRMYRCLFVYSLGFYEMLNQIFDHANDKNMLIASVWKIFGILLESCSKEEYKMVVIELEKQKLHLKQEMEKEVQKQKDIIAKIESRENEIKDRLELQIKQLQMEKQNLLIEQRKIQSDFVQADNAYNQEVTIRLKFEHKINEVNSIHRELLIKHERLLKDFKQLQKQVDKHNQEIMERTNNQIKQQSQISQLKQSDRQNGQTIELYKISELKQKEKFEEYEKNIERLFKEKSQFQKTIQDMENHMAILKMENNKNLSQISIQQNQNEEMGNLIKLLKDEKEEQKKISEKQFNEIKKAQIEIQSLKNYKEEISQKHDLLDKQLLKSQKIAADYKREIEEQGKKQRDNLVQIESQQMEIENQKKRIENLERAVKFIKESKLQADLMVEDVREKMSIVKEEYLALQQKQQTQIKLMRGLEEDLEEKKQKIVELQNIIDEEQEKNEKLEIEKVDLVGKQQEKLGKIEVNYEYTKKEIEKMTIRQGELHKELLDKKQQVILLEDEKEQLQLDLQNKKDYLEQKIEESKQLHAKLIETQQNLQVSQEERRLAVDSMKTLEDIKNREIQFLKKQKQDMELKMRSKQGIEQIYYEDIYSEYYRYREKNEKEIQNQNQKILELNVKLENESEIQRKQFNEQVLDIQKKNNLEIQEFKGKILEEQEKQMFLNKEKQELQEQILKEKNRYNEANLQIIEIKQEKNELQKQIQSLNEKIEEFQQKIQEIQTNNNLDEFDKEDKSYKSKDLNSKNQNQSKENEEKIEKIQYSVQIHNIIALTKEKNFELAKENLQNFFEKKKELEEENKKLERKIQFLQNQSAKNKIKSESKIEKESKNVSNIEKSGKQQEIFENKNSSSFKEKSLLKNYKKEENFEQQIQNKCEVNNKDGQEIKEFEKNQGIDQISKSIEIGVSGLNQLNVILENDKNNLNNQNQKDKKFNDENNLDDIQKYTNLKQNSDINNNFGINNLGVVWREKEGQDIFVVKNQLGEILGCQEIRRFKIEKKKKNQNSNQSNCKEIEIEDLIDFENQIVNQRNWKGIMVTDNQGNQVVLEWIGKINQGQQKQQQGVQNDQQLNENLQKQQSSIKSKNYGKIEQNLSDIKSSIKNQSQKNKSQKNQSQSQDQSQIYQNVSNLISQNNSSVLKRQVLGFNYEKSRSNQNIDLLSQQQQRNSSFVQEYSPQKRKNQEINNNNLSQSQIESEQDISAFISKDQQNHYNLQSKLDTNSSQAQNQSQKSNKKDFIRNVNKSNLVFQQKNGSIQNSQVKNLSQQGKIGQLQEYGQFLEQQNKNKQDQNQIQKELYKGPQQKAGDFARKFQMQANYYKK